MELPAMPISGLRIRNSSSASTAFGSGKASEFSR
jgi:hypothetical protein